VRLFRSKWAAVAFWLIVVGAIIAVIGPSKAFEDCIRNRNDDYSQHAAQKEVTLLIEAISWARARSACGFVAANENTGALTGLSGIAVALFTGTLWWVTRNMVRIADIQRTDTLRAVAASEKAAEASVGVEIPRLAVEEITPVPGAGERTWYPRVAVTVRNYGRTPAFLIGEAICYHVGLELPPKLQYDYAIDLPAGKIIKDGGIHEITRRGMHIRLNAETVASMKNCTTRFWIFGYVVYTDFLRTTRWFNFRAFLQMPVPTLDEPIPGIPIPKPYWVSVPPVRKDDSGPD
jgi:hypothetical protein